MMVMPSRPLDCLFDLDGLLLERNDDVLQINIRGRIKRIPRDHVISVQLINPGA